MQLFPDSTDLRNAYFELEQQRVQAGTRGAECCHLPGA